MSEVTNHLANLANLAGVKKTGQDIAHVASEIRHLVDARSEPNATQAVSGQDNFLSVLKASLSTVSNTQLTADGMRDAYVQGSDKVSLAQVMLAVQKSTVEFQSLLAVRNKIIAAYQDIMNMPV